MKEIYADFNDIAADGGSSPTNLWASVIEHDGAYSMHGIIERYEP